MFFNMAHEFPVNETIPMSGPSYYPKLLCFFMVIFGMGGILTTARMPKDKYIEIPNIKNILFLVIILAIWAFLWQRFGYFYQIAFLAVGAILFYLNPEPISLKKIRNTVIIDVIIVGIFYIVFNLIMSVRI